MGLSSMPSPSEGILTLLLVNTVIYVSILREIFRSVLHLLRLRSPEPAPQPQQQQAFMELFAASIEPSVTECFRSRFKPVRFGSAFGARSRTVPAERVAADCRVCLSRFEPESVVNRLPCGHLFHRACLETWLDYSHATCPLCRTHILSGDGGGGAATY